MVDIGVGALGYVGYGIEVTEGVAVAPTKFLAATSVSFPSSNDYLTPLAITKSRDHTIAMPAPYSVQGTVDMSLPVDDIASLLRSAFTATVATSPYAGGSGYTHVFTPAAVTPTFTFEVSAQDQLIMRYSGVRVNTLELKAAFGEICTANFGLDGVDRAKYAGAAATPVYAATSVYPLHFNGATVTIAGSANTLVKDWTFNVNNNVEHIGTLRASRAYKRVAMGAREMGLSMSLDFADSAEYDRLLADSEFAVSLYLEGVDLTGNVGKKTSLKIDLPRVKYKTVGVPINAGDFISQDVECTVLKPNSASAIATVTLVANEAVAS
jgi:hypothetical protein